MVARGWTNALPAAAGRHDVRILEWNTNGNLVGPARIARLAARQRADMVVLPQIRAAADGRRFEPAFRAAGLRMRPYPAISRHEVETIVFVRAGLGRYARRAGHSADLDRSAAISPLTRGLPRILALHAAQPTLRGNADWNADLAWVARACVDANTVAVGDFNATLDGLGGGGLGRCRDAAAARHAASVGSWPTFLPTWAGMPLDHVLVGSAWTPRSFTVLTDEDRSGARHRPTLTVLSRAR
jgi:endonuclease/exonuclease/phosphatase (EEP) superfamily protein YafD